MATAPGKPRMQWEIKGEGEGLIRGSISAMMGVIAVQSLSKNSRQIPTVAVQGPVSAEAASGRVPGEAARRGHKKQTIERNNENGEGKVVFIGAQKQRGGVINARPDRGRRYPGADGPFPEAATVKGELQIEILMNK
ncbi:predicted protein [Histoplasma capsulatum H143]|uniref:Uncharacterized protein n=1 Tax=Ajellomyces capsulatus (strain H143) TaxID=544712 RepID=C6HIC8_AJECH|nr:predicted protein [Histoplasma capsulatum H143]